MDSASITASFIHMKPRVRWNSGSVIMNLETIFKRKIITQEEIFKRYLVKG